MDFQRDINQMIKTNRFERQFQIYSMKLVEREKQSKYRMYARNNLQVKYFKKFFSGLEVYDSIEYYTNLR